ncbi:MAG: tryptophan 7-halogenase [Alteromonadaceae bacterium]|nr:tryptophan 7-halogenase [Alteromonadaceae bacterium]
MSKSVRNIVIVGGGTAGWITAGVLAADHIVPNDENSVTITLIESSDIPIIGVGEGTWPSMRDTLRNMGIDEGEFLTECDASFKQGSKFVNWLREQQHSYYHPFSLPEKFFQLNLANHWVNISDKINFSNAVTYQGMLCDHDLAPKQITTPQYAFAANYGYHLDAGKFSHFLKQHCVDKLGVKHIVDTISDVKQHANGDIASVVTNGYGDVTGDLFIDCSGLHGLLLDKVYKVPFVSRRDVLGNDSALAVQVPYANQDDIIQSATVATAQKNGWIWDIGLQSRRGVGHVYCSDFCTDTQAEDTLRKYIAPSMGSKAAENANIRKLSINPGHRECFWQNNCVAVGMAAGFIEPLEASAIALVEQSAKFISTQLPENSDLMPIIAKRFNDKFLDRWQQIIDFLKLHYVLTQRTDSDYWQDHKNLDNVSDGLKEKLTLWQTRTPYTFDSTATEELFPSASYQYVYYGMEGQTRIKFNRKLHSEMQQAQAIFKENAGKTQKMLSALNTNRELLNKIKQYGLAKV